MFTLIFKLMDLLIEWWEDIHFDMQDRLARATSFVAKNEHYRNVDISCRKYGLDLTIIRKMLLMLEYHY